MALNTLKIVFKLTCTENAIEMFTNAFTGFDVDFTTIATKSISSIDILSNDSGIRIELISGKTYTMTLDDVSIVDHKHTTSYDADNGTLNTHAMIKHNLDVMCAFVDPIINCH